MPLKSANPQIQKDSSSEAQNIQRTHSTIYIDHHNPRINSGRLDMTILKHMVFKDEEKQLRSCQGIGELSRILRCRNQQFKVVHTQISDITSSNGKDQRIKQNQGPHRILQNISKQLERIKQDRQDMEAKITKSKAMDYLISDLTSKVDMNSRKQINPETNMTANRQQTSRGNSSSALDLKEYLGLLGNDKLIPQLPRFHIQIANNVEPFQAMRECLQHMCDRDYPIPPLQLNWQQQNPQVSVCVQDHPELINDLLTRHKTKHQKELLPKYTKWRHRSNYLSTVLKHILPSSSNQSLYHKVMFMLGKQYQIRASVEVNADYWSRVDRSLELVEYQIYEEQFAEYNFQPDSSPASMWKKAFSLFKGGRFSHQILVCHLMFHGQDQLIAHLQARMAGKASTFFQDQKLYENNTHYRQIIRLLSGNYDFGLEESENKLYGNRIESLWRLLRVYTFQLQDKGNTATVAKLLSEFQQSVVKEWSDALFVGDGGDNQLYVSLLGYTFYYDPLCQILHQHQLISYIEHLSLLAVLTELGSFQDIELQLRQHSQLQLTELHLRETDRKEPLFGDYSQIRGRLEKAIGETVKNVTPMDDICTRFNVLMAFLPICLRSQHGRQDVIDAICSSQQVLQYLFRQINYRYWLLDYLALSWHQLESIVEQSLRLHSNHLFFVQTLLSEFVRYNKTPSSQLIANRACHKIPRVSYSSTRSIQIHNTRQSRKSHANCVHTEHPLLKRSASKLHPQSQLLTRSASKVSEMSSKPKKVQKCLEDTSELDKSTKSSLLLLALKVSVKQMTKRILRYPTNASQDNQERMLQQIQQTNSLVSQLQQGQNYNIFQIKQQRQSKSATEMSFQKMRRLLVLIDWLYITIHMSQGVVCNEYRAVLDAYNFLLSLEKSNKVTWEILQHELAQIEANWARIFIVFLDRMLQSFILFDKRKVMLKNSHQVPKVIGYLRELAIVLGKKKPEEKDILDHFLKKMFEVANAFKQ